MIVINSNVQTNTLKWTIKKGFGDETEDFSRSTVSLYLTTANNKFPVHCECNKDGLVKAVIPSGLPNEVYGVQLIWFKNNYKDLGGRHIQKTRKENAFEISVTGLESPQDITITTVASPYGYDGLSAYEIAVLTGATDMDEKQWAENMVGTTCIQMPIVDVTGSLHEILADREIKDGQTRLFTCGDSNGNITNGVVALHPTIAEIVHIKDVESGKRVGCHLGDILCITKVGESYVGKILTDDETRFDNDLWIPGLMTPSEKADISTRLSFKTHQVGGNNFNESLTSGVYPYNWKTSTDHDGPIFGTGKSGQFDLYVFASTTGDDNGYYGILQFAVCREGDVAGNIYVRNIFYKDVHFKNIGRWKCLTDLQFDTDTEKHLKYAANTVSEIQVDGINADGTSANVTFSQQKYDVLKNNVTTLIYDGMSLPLVHELSGMDLLGLVNITDNYILRQVLDSRGLGDARVRTFGYGDGDEFLLHVHLIFDDTNRNVVVLIVEV